MPSSTTYYGLGFFDFGDPLGTDFAGQIEVDRFVFIDKQLYGLMTIFGNGVLSGWEASTEETFSVSISPGAANINFVSSRTNFPVVVSDFPPNSTNYIYAKKLERTGFAEDTDFIIWPTADLLDPNFLLLSEVVTGPASIESIDNTVRQTIGFIELIRAAIRLHKHRGGSLHPSKIDLESEVRGQLPSFRIADFDAEKVNTGTFDLARMPLIDHQDLQNVGLLTHPQLDSFVKTLESSNKEIFGEISTSNLLQLILALKYIYDDPDSPFYIDGIVDENFINEFAIIPGITPDSFIDFDNSTASINLEDHYIDGVAPSTGTSFYVNYDTNLAWNSAYSLDNLAVSNDKVTLAFNEDEESSIITIEGFESATASGQDLSGGDQTLFTKETVIISDNAAVESNDSATNVIEGFYSGKFSYQQSFRVQFVKEFSEAQNWTTYDSFVLWVKCIDIVHGPVKMYFENSSGDKSIDYIILNDNQVTSNSDQTANDFEARWVDLSTVPFRDSIKKIVIYTDDVDSQFNFFVDHINIQRAILLPEEGILKLRYASGTNVVFSTIEWDSTEPTGTDLTVRARAADGTALLGRASYTPFLTNGDVINLDGTDIEIEVKFYPDNDRINAPILNSLRILLVTEAEIDGFKIDDESEFSRGTVQNVNVEPDFIELDTPIFVDSYYFALANIVNQVHEETSGSTTFTQSDNVALFGAQSPVAPNTVFSSVEEMTGESASPRFFEPRSVIRKEGRTFVIADTYNDRVLEYNEDGTLVAGFGSVNYEHSNKVFPISASFDVRTGILYVVWSKKISFKTVDVSHIVIQTSTQQVQLIKDFDKILGLTTSELDDVNAEGQIMPIYMSVQNSSIVELMPANSTYMLADNSTLSSGIDTSSEFYRKITTVLGIPVFVGNFAYIDGVFSPTWADKTDSGTYMVANGKVAVKEWDFPEEAFPNGSESISLNSNVSSIIEVDANNQLIYGVDNVMQFSPFIPGRVEKIGENTLLIGGLRPGGQLGSLGSGQTLDFRSIGGPSETRKSQKEILNEMFFERSSNPYVGAVVIYDMLSNSTTFEYTSAEGILVSDVDIDPVSNSYVVAESSFDKSGRVIKLDASGNIVFSFGEGTYSIINDINVQIDGSIVVST